MAVRAVAEMRVIVAHYGLDGQTDSAGVENACFLYFCKI